MASEKTFFEIDGKTYLQKHSKFAMPKTKSPIHVSDNMSGKMFGIPSISTSCVCNPICIARQKQGNSICAHCFAVGTIKHYSSLGKALASNFELLNAVELPKEQLPIFKPSVEIVRIESFGDIASETQAVNYTNIIKRNPHAMFGWWSKNMNIIKPVFDTLGKPSNVVMIESSPLIDVECAPSNEYVDKTFTVYSYDGSHINCGKRSCMGCRRCYKKSTEKSVKEFLK